MKWVDTEEQNDYRRKVMEEIFKDGKRKEKEKEKKIGIV